MKAKEFFDALCLELPVHFAYLVFTTHNDPFAVFLEPLLSGCSNEDLEQIQNLSMPGSLTNLVVTKIVKKREFGKVESVGDALDFFDYATKDDDGNGFDYIVKANMREVLINEMHASPDENFLSQELAGNAEVESWRDYYRNYHTFSIDELVSSYPAVIAEIRSVPFEELEELDLDIAAGMLIQTGTLVLQKHSSKE